MLSWPLLVLLMILLLGGTIWFALSRGKAEGTQDTKPRLR
jgi:hypothetical protein